MVNNINLNQRKIIDITLPLHSCMEKPLPTFEGFQFQWKSRIEKGQHNNLSKFSMESHVGTHVDAPLHFVSGGKSIDEIPVNRLIGKAQVIEVPYPQVVTDDFLKSRLKAAKIVIFKFGRERLNQEYPYFSIKGVRYLNQQKIQVVGTDNYSIDSKTTKWKIHHMMLGQEVIVVESLLLKNILPGVYEFICLPLLVKGGEASPARALLID
ncbi:MAG: hypothetical protein DRH33_09525 [Candidatus Nealsonbacteria bacterium]|nr:MAG: hypothetical protein DRH33_09525 [Candidatus Nealsonbacteria bacterium]